MLQCERQNVHHSKMPKAGTIGYIVGLSTVNALRKCIVTAYPLTDSADYRFSVGIHTLFVCFLDDRTTERFSGTWFVAE
jgi:hypothetical protein